MFSENTIKFRFVGHINSADPWKLFKTFAADEWLNLNQCLHIKHIFNNFWFSAKQTRTSP